jgi:hypothetical protein
MKFIKVTLCEGITGKKPISELEKIENYLLPVYGIKSISEKATEPGTYYITICDSHIPNENEFDFKVDHAEAKLSKGFIDIVN